MVASKMSILNSTRGLRNRNPGNLKELPGDKTLWVGERATNDDPIFEEFDTFEHGIRALGRVLDSYANRGILTVEQIIKTYAPDTENNTGAYIRSIESQTGLLANHVVTDADRVALVAAIIKHENGINPFSDAFIAEGLALA